MIATDHQIMIAAEIALREYPRECVVAFKKSGGAEKLDNVAINPESEFAVNPARWAEIAGGTAVLVHSHPDGPDYPSEADMRTQVALGVPFGIIMATAQGAGGYFEFGGDALDLLERPFRHGVTDCYALIKDYYLAELGIDVPEYPRAWEWWLQGGNLYEDNTQEVGFKRIDISDATPGDMLTFSIRGKVCHAGVYLGDGLMLHHLGGNKGYDASRKPLKEPIGRWERLIAGVYRHTGKDK